MEEIRQVVERWPGNPRITVEDDILTAEWFQPVREDHFRLLLFTVNIGLDRDITTLDYTTDTSLAYTWDQQNNLLHDLANAHSRLHLPFA